MSIFRRKLGIIDYPWHQAHLYRLHALPANFWMARIRYPLWNHHQRPVPDNFRGGLDEADIRKRIRKGRLGLALLHLDQWCEYDTLRSFPFRMMKNLAQDIPRIIIMHGTPDSPENRRRTLRMIGNLPVVCNSEQARREWDGGEDREDKYDLPQFRTIIHGYKVDEFFNLPLESRRKEAITICSGGSMSRWYHGTTLVERLMRDIPDLHWLGPMGDRKWANTYKEYRVMLASSLIYLSPTRRAPMPGSRTEAMLSGCCIVSVPGNDWREYVHSGDNGVIVNDYRAVRAVLQDLISRPQAAYEMGQRGRDTARLAFEHTRFVEDWCKVLDGIGVDL